MPRSGNNRNWNSILVRSSAFHHRSRPFRTVHSECEMCIPENRMSDDSVKRYPASYLCDIMYGVEPMTREIAIVVRYLRFERKLSYSEVGWVLCEQGAGSAVCFQIGHSFSTLAATFLQEPIQDGWL